MNAKNLLKISLLCVVCAFASNASAQQTIGQLPPLHVDGRQLKDAQGNTVVLHGVMDTPSCWFNGGRWGWRNYDNNAVMPCLNYFGAIFDVITDNEKGAYCNLFRLHLDPCWTNDPNKQSDGKESGEADISRYSGARLTQFLNSLYLNIAKRAVAHNMYVIMRPPGVCPHTIKVGDDYQKFLLDVWDRVSKNSTVQKYSGQISLELANEPVTLLDANGKSSEKALHDFFQPIVDKIRANGFNGVIWIPGTGYQSNYKEYAKYPITGDNIGYAVHVYAGWYGQNSNSASKSAFIKQFAEQVPMVYTNPIVVTEVDWSPEKQPKEFDHKNEWGADVYKNYGSWATAPTKPWGEAYKAVLDYYGNISMTLSSTGCYIDIDDCLKPTNNNSTFKLTGNVTPAFKLEMEKGGKIDPYQGCGVACFEWYADYAKKNYASTERYQPKQELPANPFDMREGVFNPSIFYNGTISNTNSAYSLLTLTKDGFMGWRFDDEGIDLSGYTHLAIRLNSKFSLGKVSFRIYDSSNYWDEAYEYAFERNKDEMLIDLQNMTTKSGRKIDPSHIRMAGFISTMTGMTLRVKEVVALGDEVSVETPEAVGSENDEKSDLYDLNGRKANSHMRGIYIQNGKKMLAK